MLLYKKITNNPWFTEFFTFFSSLLGISQLIFFFNVLIKTIFLSRTPPLLTNDEMYYATEAQAIIAYGSDLTGDWRPWHLAPANPIYSELTGLTYSLGFLLFPDATIVALKVVPVLMGSLIPILLALIAYKFFGQKIFFITTALVATFNPWLFQFSRMSFDSLASVFFYCLGIVTLLYFKGWKLLLALIPFTLGFYQYQGHKPLLVPLVGLTLAYLLTSETKNRNFWQKKYLPHLTVMIGAVLLVGIYLIRLPHLSSSMRVNEVLINTEALSQEVYANRRLSLTHFSIPWLENKGTVFIRNLIYRFFASFDIIWLFQQGNAQIDSFAVTEYGFLYGIDALLILIAGWLLTTEKKWRLPALYLAGLLLISTIPTLLKHQGVWITFRGSFTVLTLVLLVSLAIGYLLNLKKWWLHLVLIGLYSASVFSFAYHYFMTYPVLTTKDLFFYNRVLASYVKRQPHQKLVIYSGNPRQIFEIIIGYNHLITAENRTQLTTAYQQEKYQLNNVSVDEKCFDYNQVIAQPDTTFIVDYRIPPCADTTIPPLSTMTETPIALSSLIDSGRMYTIYNDAFCEELTTSVYMRVINSMFDVERLPKTTFCQDLFIRMHP